MLKWVLLIGHGLRFNCLGWSGCLLICFHVVVQRWVTPDLSALKSVGEHAARSFEVEMFVIHAAAYLTLNKAPRHKHSTCHVVQHMQHINSAWPLFCSDSSKLLHATDSPVWLHLHARCNVSSDSTRGVQRVEVATGVAVSTELHRGSSIAGLTNYQER